MHKLVKFSTKTNNIINALKESQNAIGLNHKSLFKVEKKNIYSYNTYFYATGCLKKELINEINL